MELTILIWIACAGVGAMINGGTGAALGLLLGPIGVIISIIMVSGK